MAEASAKFITQITQRVRSAPTLSAIVQKKDHNPPDESVSTKQHNAVAGGFQPHLARLARSLEPIAEVEYSYDIHGV